MAASLRALPLLTLFACGLADSDSVGGSDGSDPTITGASEDAGATADPSAASADPTVDATSSPTDPSATDPGAPTAGGSSTTDVPDPTDESGSDTSTQADLGTIVPGCDHYFTDFPLEENPISEDGAWTAIASPWLRIRTIDGIAKPDAYVTNYNDNYAHLNGCGPDVEITATVYIAGDAPFGELLLLARMDDTATTNRGYEFLYDGDGSVQLMRWDGPEGGFVAMGGESGNPGPLQDFDQLRMRVEGDTITIFHRRPPGDFVEIGQTIDDTWADGQPGMGFFVRDRGQTIDAIGFRDYAVEEL